MDSINKNQSEHNQENLSGSAAVERIRALVEEAQTCFFCTEPNAGDSLGTRPMSVRQVDDDGVLWLLSASDSHKNEEVQHNPEVKLYMQGSSHSDFLYLHGTASISTDRAKIKELWTPVIKTWFTGGIDDPRITVIRVQPIEGYYWDTRHGMAVAGVKMLLGAALGKTMDDSVEGNLHV